MKKRSLAMLCLLLNLLACPALFGAVPVPVADTAAKSMLAPHAYERTLYLVRHGAYDQKAPDSADGPGLTSLGIAQARLIAERLHALPVHFERIIASSMLRAQQTAAEVSAQLPQVPLEQSPLLRECTPPMRNEPAKDEKEHQEQQECFATLERAFAQFFVPAHGTRQHQVLVCHGNVIRYFVTRALLVDREAWPSMSVGNASLTVIRVRADGTFRVLAVGDVGHIPPSLQSGTGGDDPLLEAK